MKHSYGRGFAAMALGIPLTIAPVAAPAAAQAATLVDATGPFGSYGPGYGGPSLGYGYEYGGSSGFGLGGGSGTESPLTSSSSQPNATAATATQSAGVVLIDTVLDYGEGEAAGTGLVISPSGLVVTNHHVIADSTKITVTTADGSTYAASVVGYDASHDVALLQLKGASGLATVTTDTSTATKSEAVDAIGNAEGEGALTDASGEVTRPSTNITVTEDDGSQSRLTGLIESDADVVPGDSGGAWLDAAGDVVGMTVAASEGGASTYGYAIPIKRVITIATRIENGKVSKTIVIGTKAAIGIELASTTRLEVAAVESSAARKAGLTSGDVITAVDGTKVSTIGALTKILRQHQPGDQIKLSWTTAAGTHQTKTIALVSGPVA